MANSLKRFLTIFGYKLDRKWGNFKARVKEKTTDKSGGSTWGGVRTPIESLRKKKKSGFGKLDDRNVPQELPAFGAYCNY
ncbi:uncharacterized protein LOC144157989 [Haemaphysalis longicornis]|uniref:Uncharacterized protein n=1 Tax=Haemaphysalis longicornis TaxID=44386 RepID=A0A9J6FJZ5_HAELO|nr:hypothetical protein HPB48_019458 [Haemaphysalis longicornis]